MSSFQSKDGVRINDYSKPQKQYLLQKVKIIQLKKACSIKQKKSLKESDACNTTQVDNNAFIGYKNIDSDKENKTIAKKYFFKMMLVIKTRQTKKVKQRKIVTKIDIY